MSSYVDYDLESGKCAYEAYHEADDHEWLTSEHLPKWDELPKKVQDAWIAAAQAVLKRESDRAAQF